MNKIPKRVVSILKKSATPTSEDYNRNLQIPSPKDLSPYQIPQKHNLKIAHKNIKDKLLEIGDKNRISPTITDNQLPNVSEIFIPSKTKLKSLDTVDMENTKKTIKAMTDGKLFTPTKIIYDDSLLSD